MISGKAEGRKRGRGGMTGSRFSVHGSRLGGVTPARGRPGKRILYKRIRSPLTHIVGKNVDNGTKMFSYTSSVTVLYTTLRGKNR